MSLPNESCAILLSNRGDEKAIIVTEILPVRNARATYASFEIPPDELLQAYNHAERAGLQVVGIFHSHPSAPSPSLTDIRFMEINPVIWVIYSLTENRFAAWTYEGEVREVSMIMQN